ncbi:sensor histidine kinase [Vagococcus sp.]|uniref:sensor histidine kinase n=1 Tax=Vagococcus sp. TaxID=1933889 RepID=UPI003F9D2492
MKSTKNYLFEEIIDVDKLMYAQKKLSNLLNVSVITADPKGNTKGELVNFISFCSLIRSSEEGARRCELSGTKITNQSFKEKKTCVHDCYLGLKDCAAPIIVDDVLIGAVLGGQAFIEGEEYRRENFDVPELAKELSLPETELRQAIAEIPVVPEDYIYKCLDMYGFLANYFAEMGMKSITQKALLKETEEKYEFQKKAKDAQLKTIEAQINPHFLFNTLNSAAREAMFEGAPKTEEMIYCISDLLRYNLRQYEEFPRLVDELESIKRYLYIQHIRYTDRIEYHVSDLEQSCGYRIPAMIIQPMVENAVIHGLEPKKKGGKIKVEVSFEKEHIEIVVQDNGVGIQEKCLETLLEDEKEENTSLGLRNSHGRLRGYFGEKYGLHISSRLNQGTKVQIRFPYFKAKSEIVF